MGFRRTFYTLCLSIIFPLVLFWQRIFQRSETRLHRARFAHTLELKHLLSLCLPTQGLLLGTHFLHAFVSVQSQETHHELGNLLIVGPTRSGKGLLATSQLLSWQHSVIVNDIKGELFLSTAGYRRSLGPVFVIDPRGVGHSFDPLSERQSEDALYSSATQLLFQADEGEGRIFTQRAADMLTQLFLAARQEGIAPLLYVRCLLRLGLAAVAKRLSLVDPLLATQFLDEQLAEANLADRFLLSSWGTLKARLRPLLTETVVRCLTRADFTPRELMRGEKPVSVYLRWPERDLLALSPLVRLAWGSLIDELITTHDAYQGNGCRPVLLLIDEAGRTAIPSLADHATTVAGRNITIAMAVQSLSQLETIYGRARAQTLKDNMDTQLYYPPRDLSTAQHIEYGLGQVSAYAHSQTVRVGGAESEGHSERPISLLTAQEIRQLKEDEVICFHRRLPPVRLKRMDWRGQSLLAQRRTIPAPPLPRLPLVDDIPFASSEEQPAYFPTGYIDLDR